MTAEKKIIAFSFSYTFGVGWITIHPIIPQSYVYIVYIVAAVLFIISFGMKYVFAHTESLRWLPYLVLCLSAVFFALARTTQCNYIPPLKDNKEAANHISWFLDKSFDEKSTVVGNIITAPDVFEDYTDIILQPTKIVPDPDNPDKQYKINSGRIMIKVYDKPDMEEIYAELANGDAYGYIVQLNNVSILALRPASNPGTLDYKRFLNHQDIYGTVYVSNWNDANPPIEILKKTKGNLLTEWSLQLRDKMLGVFKKTMPYPYSAFLGGVTLGLRAGLKNSLCLFESALPEKERRLILDEFRVSGTSHVLAVSGLHTTILAGLFYGIFLLFRIPKKIFAPIVVLCLIIFTIVTGARPATIRACFMNSFLILTLVYLKATFTTSSLLAISIAAMIMLIHSPALVFEASFVLSFMAVLSLIVITPPIEVFFKKYMRFLYILPNGIVTFMGAQIAIQLGMMLPLSAAYFNRFSIAGPFANFIAIPLITAIVPMGILAGVIGLIPIIGTKIALLINATNWLCVWFFLWIVHISSVIFSYPFIKEFTPGILGSYYLVLGLIVFSSQIRVGINHLSYKLFGFGGGRTPIKIIGLTSSFIAMVIAIIWFLTYEKPDKRLKITFLDVGYGNCVHIETPNGTNLLLDAGRNGKFDFRKPYDVGERTVIPYLLSKRIATIDYLLATNTREEDITGLVSVINILPVDRIYSIINPSSLDLKSRSEKGFTKSFAEALGDDYLASNIEKNYVKNRANLMREMFRNISKPWDLKEITQVFCLSPFRFIKELFGILPKNPKYIIPSEMGEVIHSEKGPDGKKLEIFFLHPSSSNWKKQLDKNTMVVKINYGAVGVLLTSTIEQDVETELASYSKYLHADIISVPSHGSKYGSTRRFLKIVKPKYAVCQYGRITHLPARSHKVQEIKESIEFTGDFYKKLGIKFLRTDLTGAVSFYTDGKTIEYESAIPPELKAEDESAETNKKEVVEF